MDLRVTSWQCICMSFGSEVMVTRFNRRKYFKYEVFQQDGAPCHTAKKVSKWFKDNGIQVLEWPGQSPDMNPIENLWRILKIRVSEKHAKSLDDLRDIIKTVRCSEISYHVCLNLVHSMPTRMQAVNKSRCIYKILNMTFVTISVYFCCFCSLC